MLLKLAVSFSLFVLSVSGVFSPGRESPLIQCSKASLCREIPYSSPDKYAAADGNTAIGRLPTSLWPLHYTISLRPDIYTGAPPFNFNGRVSIRFSTLQATGVIYLNQWQLNISNVNISVATDSPVSAPTPGFSNYILDNTLQFVIISLDTNLTPGAEYYVSMDYSGVMYTPGDQSALYWDSYIDHTDGTTHYLAATQYQPEYLRWTMPSFDEPVFKAVYDVSLERRPVGNTIALGNMPLINTENLADGWIRDTFDSTVKMSCYLLCFIVGEFDYQESITNRGTVVRVWSRPDALFSTDFALSAAVPILEWFEEYTGVNYPLPKLDHIALPSRTGAMENWGLVPYAEYYLLVDPQTTTSAQKTLVAQVIAHEVAHKWFGNYITCVWWNNTWLNEGFATFFEYNALEALGWPADEIQVYDSIYRIMSLDGQNDSYPVRVEVESPFDADISFNTFTYNKGGAVLRMLENFLTPETFRRGLQYYLNTHAYSSVQTHDLWDALTRQAYLDGVVDTNGRPYNVTEKMDPWVDQRGFPYLTTTREFSGVLQFTQSQFLSPSDQTISTESPWNYLWHVPLTYVTSTDGSTEVRDWMNRESTIYTSNGAPSDTATLIMNPGFRSYYHVIYDQKSKDQLDAILLNFHTQIDVMSRGQMINDAFVLSRAPYSFNEVEAMDFTAYLGKELDYVPWYAAGLHLYYSYRILTQFPESAGLIVAYLDHISDPLYTSLGWTIQPNEKFLTAQLRALIQEVACTVNNTDCLTTSQNLYQEFSQTLNYNLIHPDSRETVYCAAIFAGGPTEWTFASTYYQRIADSARANYTNEREYLVEAMACTTDNAQIIRYFNDIYNSSVIRSRDTQDALLAMCDNPQGVDIVWGHLQVNWRTNPVPSGSSRFTILRAVTDYFATSARLQELQAFVTAYPASTDAEQNLYDECLIKVERNVEWMTVNQQPLITWLTQNTPAQLIKRYSITSPKSLGGMKFWRQVEKPLV